MAELTTKLSQQENYEYNSVRAITVSKGYTKQLSITVPSEYADGTYSWRVVVKSGTSDNFDSGSSDLINTSGTISATTQLITLTAAMTQSLEAGNYVLDVMVTKSTDYFLYGRYDVRSIKPNFDSGAGTITPDSLVASGELVYRNASGNITGIESASGTAFSNSNKPIDQAYLSGLPKFRVFKAGGNQTIGTTPEIVTFDTETFDIGGYFASNRYTPLVEGYYHFVTEAVYLAGTNSELVLYIYKNGANVSQSGQNTTANNYGLNSTAFLYMNGTTDYVEVFAVSTVTSRSLLSGTEFTNFSGYLVP